jgi:hypothetical protein
MAATTASCKKRVPVNGSLEASSILANEIRLRNQRQHAVGSSRLIAVSQGEADYTRLRP